MKGGDSGSIGFAKIFSIVALSITFAPFFFLLLWKLIQNWGWWRVKREKGDRVYVKTCHGWVNEDRYLKNAQKRGRTPGTRHFFGWKVTTAHLVQISWTPDGSRVERLLNTRNRSRLRRLPYWSRMRKPNAPGSSDPVDMEMGVIPEPPPVHSRSSRAGGRRVTKQRGRDHDSLEQLDGRFERPLDGEFDGPAEPRPPPLLYMMSSGLRHSSSEYNESNTVRRRFVTSDRAGAWQANSSETSRATITQFIMPTHDFRTPVWANNLFGHETARYTMTSSQSDHPTFAFQPDESASKRPLALVNEKGESPYNQGGRRAVRSSPNFSSPFTVSAAYGIGPSEMHTAAAKLDNSLDFLRRDLGYVGNAQSNLPFQLKSSRMNGPSRWQQSQSLTQRWKPRARPSINRLLSSIKRKSGHLGKRTISRVQISIQEPSTVTGDMLREYENEGSLDDAVSYHTESEASFGAVPRALSEAISDSFTTVRPTSPAVYGFYYEDIRDYRNPPAANVSGPNLAMAPREMLNAPYLKSGPLRKRASRGSNTGPMSPTTPRLVAHSTSLSSSRIPSMSLADATTQATAAVLKKRDITAGSTIPEELRERLPWLDLRCTMRMKKGNTLHSLYELEEHTNFPTVSVNGPRSRRGLRRVGNFLEPGQRSSEGVSKGKENMPSVGSVHGITGKVRTVSNFCSDPQIFKSHD
ncbi:MAG: hypothetical protein Q9191_005058 [Dirinaria sp. TL-2023a]